MTGGAYDQKGFGSRNDGRCGFAIRGWLQWWQRCRRYDDRYDGFGPGHDGCCSGDHGCRSGNHGSGCGYRWNCWHDQHRWLV